MLSFNQLCELSDKLAGLNTDELLPVQEAEDLGIPFSLLQPLSTWIAGNEYISGREALQLVGKIIMSELYSNPEKKVRNGEVMVLIHPDLDAYCRKDMNPEQRENVTDALLSGQDPGVRIEWLPVRTPCVRCAPRLVEYPVVIDVIDFDRDWHPEIF